MKKGRDVDYVIDTPENILEELAEYGQEFEELFVVGINGNKISYVAESGIFPDQKDEIISILCRSFD